MRNRRHPSPLRARHPATAQAIAFALAVAGCGGASPGAGTTPPPRVAPPPAAPASVSESSKDKVGEAPLTATRRGVITKAELQQHLEAGPQEFIQKVRVQAAFRQGRFLGWRIVAYEGPGPVRAGDIVLRVNGGSIERPEQFMQVWSGLGKRRDLVVELLRQGRPVSLRFPIVD